MADFEIKVPFKPVWTKDAQKFVDRIRKDLGNVGVGKGGGGITGGLAGARGGSLTKLLGPVLGTVIAAILGLLNSFKGVFTILKVMAKMLSEFLRPVADVIILLLLPVLAILRPILMVMRQIMQPFRKAALQLSAQGAKALKEGREVDAAALFGLSIKTGLAGLSAVVSVLFKDIVNLVITGIGEFVKIIVGSLLTGLAFVVGIFNSTAGDKILEFKDNVIAGIETSIKGITDFIDISVATIILSQTNAIIETAKHFGVDLSETFLPEVVKVIDSVILNDSNSVQAVFKDNLVIFQDEVGSAIDTAFGSVVARAKSKLAELDSAVASAQRSRRNISSILRDTVRGFVRSAATTSLPII